MGASRELEPAWRVAFELAWEAFAAGTIPVGALVTDADGELLARERNRIAESSAPKGQIYGSRVAVGRVAFAASDIYGGAAQLSSSQIDAADSATNPADGPRQRSSSRAPARCRSRS